MEKQSNPVEIRVMKGETLRDWLLEIGRHAGDLPLGELVRITASNVSYRDNRESFRGIYQYPDYECVRELLNKTIEILIQELNDRERRYCGL